MRSGRAQGEGRPLSWAPSAHAVAGGGRPFSWAPSAHAVAGEGHPLSWVSGGSGTGRYSLRSPSAHAVAGGGSMRFTEQLRQQAAAVRERVFQHPFVTGIGDGTLPLT